VRISLRVRQLLGEEPQKRGFITRMEKQTGVDRHTIRAVLDNKTSSVNMDILSRICDFLIAEQLVAEQELPGVLLGRDAEELWDLLASCDRVEFCVGARMASEWPGAAYVMSPDSRLQGVLLSRISQLKYGPSTGPRQGQRRVQAGKPGGPSIPDATPAEGEAVKVGKRLFSAFHLMAAPTRHARPDAPGEGWDEACRQAQEAYRGLARYREKRALIAMGSIKVNPVVEVMLANLFSAPPFAVPDQVNSARQRRCPIFFRFRDSDPQPPSCCGGTRLAKRSTSDEIGVYYETVKDAWLCCPHDADHDAAFIYCADRRPAGMVELACGGFSARATSLMTDNLEQITSRLGWPQYQTHDLHLGLYVIQFNRRARDRRPDSDSQGRDWTFDVIPISNRSLQRRLTAQAR
jgi:hypothetical protein